MPESFKSFLKKFEKPPEQDGNIDDLDRLPESPDFGPLPPFVEKIYSEHPAINHYINQINKLLNDDEYFKKYGAEHVRETLKKEVERANRELFGDSFSGTRMRLDSIKGKYGTLDLHCFTGGAGSIKFVGNFVEPG